MFIENILFMNKFRIIKNLHPQEEGLDHQRYHEDESFLRPEYVLRPRHGDDPPDNLVDLAKLVDRGPFLALLVLLNRTGPYYPCRRISSK